MRPWDSTKQRQDDDDVHEQHNLIVDKGKALVVEKKLH